MMMMSELAALLRKGQDRWDYIEKKEKQGYSQSEIASKLQLSPGALKVWKSRNKSKFEVIKNIIVNDNVIKKPHLQENKTDNVIKKNDPNDNLNNVLDYKFLIRYLKDKQDRIPFADIVYSRCEEGRKSDRALVKALMNIQKLVLEELR